MQTIGKLFKEKREEMLLSLKEVEHAISVRTVYLEAIEEGKIEKFSSPTHAMGFFKQYASFLGFDGEKMIREHSGFFHKKTFVQTESLEQKDFSPSRQKGAKGSWILIVGALIFFVSSWFLAKIFEIF